MELKDFGGAVEDHTAAIALRPTWGVPYYNRALAKERLGEHDGALDDYAAALRHSPNHPAADFAAKRTKKIKQGDGGSFSDDYNELIRTNPDNPFGYFVRSAGSGKDAKEPSRAAREAKIRYARAISMYEQGSYKAARDELKIWSIHATLAQQVLSGWRKAGLPIPD